jgi:cytochrome c peroxidase
MRVCALPRAMLSLLGIMSSAVFVNALAQTYQWEIPPWVPAPVVPHDNPMSDKKVELGRHLFNEKRLSAEQTMSCWG